jgi:hypothetical protein
MKKHIFLATILILSLFLIAGSAPMPTIRLTLVNKSGMDIAVQLMGQDQVYANKSDVRRGQFYYLTVLKGTKEEPTIKHFDIEQNTYGMQLFYLETWDPVYGFQCGRTTPNALIAEHNLRLTVLPCTEYPCSRGEPTMWKYTPHPIMRFNYVQFRFKRMWLHRMIY